MYFVAVWHWQRRRKRRHDTHWRHGSAPIRPRNDSLCRWSRTKKQPMKSLVALSIILIPLADDAEEMNTT